MNIVRSHGCRIAALALGLVAGAAQASLIGGVEFPQGAVSFADQVTSYNVGAVSPTQPSTPHRGAFNALGTPDYAGDNSCSSQADCSFVSLGDGGSLVVRFVDNKLTGSGNSAADLWIFEVGPDVEDMFVEISVDGSTWLSVGKVGGATAGVDIDAFGFGLGSIFEYVRLTDDTALDGQSGATVGADIDAVGAISTIATPVPEPSALLLAATALLGLRFARRSRAAHGLFATRG
ncbi:MAG: PEP-CTERM sorting domain-containing protein [Burkholderiales bacterium]|nr:PEP-CTERM sorting domain-containing protein [Burkholderiales bacterium]